MASNVNEPELRAKIIGTLGVGGDMYSLPVLLDHFHDPNRALRLEAVRAVENYKKVGGRFKEQSFSHYRIIQELEDLFHREADMDVKTEVINAFSIFNEPATVEFLLATLKTSVPGIQSQCIETCNYFDDPNLPHYLMEYLHHR